MSLNYVFSVILPYCLKRNEKGKYIFLNRSYKPISFKTKEHLKYENFPVAHKILGLNGKKAGNLSWNGSNDLEEIYLYRNDPTSSVKEWNSYLKKLKFLSKLKID